MRDKYGLSITPAILACAILYVMLKGALTMDPITQILTLIAAWVIIALVCAAACGILDQSPVWGLVFGPLGVIVAAILHAGDEVCNRLAISLHKRTNGA